MQEVSKIVCREAPNLEMRQELPTESKEAHIMRQELPTESKEAHILSSGASNKESNEKGIKDYPRPLAVVGASVL